MKRREEYFVYAGEIVSQHLKILQSEHKETIHFNSWFFE